MSKLRTTSTQDRAHKKSEEFHQKLEKGARTVAVHREKVKHDEQGAQRTAPPERGHTRSRAAHLAPEKPGAARTRQPAGEPNREKAPALY